MPWSRRGKTIFVKRGGKWVKHATYKTVAKAIRALNFLRANYSD